MAVVALVAATVASYGVGWLLDRPLLVPLLNGAAGYPFMVLALRRGGVYLAVSRMLVWALALALCSTLLSYARPLHTDVLFINGESYRAQMFAWVLTGVGAESRPALFIPQQLLHAGIFAALAVLTASLAAIPMGALLMNYMGHYVGTLAAASAHPAMTMVAAWAPWADIRIASFVAMGVVLSAPLGGRLWRFRGDWPPARRVLAWAVAGLACDIALKTILAPAWQRMLLRLVGW